MPIQPAPVDSLYKNMLQKIDKTRLPGHTLGNIVM